MVDELEQVLIDNWSQDNVRSPAVEELIDAQKRKSNKQSKSVKETGIKLQAGADDIVRRKKDELTALIESIKTCIDNRAAGPHVYTKSIEGAQKMKHHVARLKPAHAHTTAVYFKQDLKAYRCIGLYIGKYFTEKEYDKVSACNNKWHKYAIEFKMWPDTQPGSYLMVDATELGNQLREMNHYEDFSEPEKSPRPNARLIELIDYRNGQAMPYIAVITLADVSQDQECLVDYGNQYFKQMITTLYRRVADLEENEKKLYRQLAYHQEKSLKYDRLMKLKRQEKQAQLARAATENQGMDEPPAAAAPAPDHVPAPQPCPGPSGGTHAQRNATALGAPGGVSAQRIQQGGGAGGSGGGAAALRGFLQQQQQQRGGGGALGAVGGAGAREAQKADEEEEEEEDGEEAARASRPALARLGAPQSAAVAAVAQQAVRGCQAVHGGTHGAGHGSTGRHMGAGGGGAGAGLWVVGGVSKPKAGSGTAVGSPSDRVGGIPLAGRATVARKSTSSRQPAHSPESEVSELESESEPEAGAGAEGEPEAAPAAAAQPQALQQNQQQHQQQHQQAAPTPSGSSSPTHQALSSPSPGAAGSPEPKESPPPATGAGTVPGTGVDGTGGAVGAGRPAAAPAQPPPTKKQRVGSGPEVASSPAAAAGVMAGGAAGVGARAAAGSGSPGATGPAAAAAPAHGPGPATAAATATVTTAVPGRQAGGAVGGPQPPPRATAPAPAFPSPPALRESMSPAVAGAVAGAAVGGSGRKAGAGAGAGQTGAKRQADTEVIVIDDDD